ncbi:thioredoxin family protein [Acanthopleuribacter pedis]|uniref:Thioredoxin domain-containing protein n=1 Tax=Acanthopleuribacter pedis TaxID=442870 RepID=A0A8J7QNB4_9BACT|nr:thioredoxin family protein [Acanthopleuribacter pedis]MBO1321578.1 hypothetical protein [Acanthopleuribacter pedis]
MLQSRYFPLFLGLLLCSLQPLLADDNTLILLTGKKHTLAGSLGFQNNMIAFKDVDGTNRMISKTLVDWPRTVKKSPELFKKVYPGRPLPKPSNTSSGYTARKQPKRQIKIDNKALKNLKPGQGLANKWDGDVPELPPEKNEEKGLIQTLFDTFTGEGTETASNEVAPKPSSGTVQISTISSGKRVEIKRFIEPGQIVMFDFYADWCGPCRKITPQLEALARKYPGRVALRKIDIKNWNSDVAKQYNIRSIPHVVLYDHKGKKKVDGNALAAIRTADQIARANGW